MLIPFFVVPIEFHLVVLGKQSRVLVWIHILDSHKDTCVNILTTFVVRLYCTGKLIYSIQKY